MARLNSYQGNGRKKKAHVKHWLIFAMHSLLRGLEINNINKFKIFTEASASVYSILVLAATLVWKPDFCSKSWIASLSWLFLWENLDWTVKFTIDAWKYLFFFQFCMKWVFLDERFKIISQRLMVFSLCFVFIWKTLFDITKHTKLHLLLHADPPYRMT